MIGRTSNTEAALDNSKPHGIITPRSENFAIEGTRFFNFDWSALGVDRTTGEHAQINAAALGTCSHCFHPAATDSGAREIRVSGLYFDEATVP